jgi:hypothetical protein
MPYSRQVSHHSPALKRRRRAVNSPFLWYVGDHCVACNDCRTEPRYVVVLRDSRPSRPSFGPRVSHVRFEFTASHVVSVVMSWPTGAHAFGLTPAQKKTALQVISSAGMHEWPPVDSMNLLAELITVYSTVRNEGIDKDKLSRWLRYERGEKTLRACVGSVISP